MITTSIPCRARHEASYACNPIAPLLAPLGWHINPAFVERINCTIRQHVAAVGRRGSTLCQGEDGLRQQLAVCYGSDHICWPHASIRQPLPQPEPTHGTDAAPRWRPCTSAMAAGLTDHVWTLREGLLCRVPPWPQPAGVGTPRGGGQRSGTLVWTGDVRPHSRWRQRHQERESH